MPSNNTKPIGFFIHHQGRGHAKRCEAIIEHMHPDRPIHIFCADTSLFTKAQKDKRVTLTEIPNLYSHDVPTQALFESPAPQVLDCVPLGIDEITKVMHELVTFFLEEKPALFFVDVSSEITLLARICSVPSAQIRMHGQRNDPAHSGAYETCIGMLAPFHEDMEQDDYPDKFKDKTFYSGGLCTTDVPILSKTDARAKLGLDPDQKIILTLTGGGGAGTPYAPLTMACRAVPEAHWIVIGPVHTEGHETDFHNLELKGWVDNATDYLAAADLVIASAGDNTVHEIAMVGRPFICIPEWRYFDEQKCKAQMLEKVGAAIYLPNWPGNPKDWRKAVADCEALDINNLKKLFDPEAAKKSADFLEDMMAELWARPRKNADLKVVA